MGKTELVLMSELSDAARDTARWEWVFNSGEPSHYMELAWEDMGNAYDFINDSIGKIVAIESVHGPGSERFFPVSSVSIYNSWGALQEFGGVNTSEVWRHCNDEALGINCANAWNRHVGRLHYLYNKLENLELWELGDLNCGSRFLPAMSSAWYENAYQTEIDSAIQDVCDVLNNYLDLSEDYSTSEGAFDEYVWECDDELWFTTDGKLYAVRGGSYFYSVDTCEDLEVTDELSASHVFVTVA